MTTTLGPADEPQEPGAIVAVYYADVWNLEIWVRKRENDGTWYLLGSEDGRILDDAYPRYPELPRWEHVLARGPVTALTAARQEDYANGWVNGRRHMVTQDMLPLIDRRPEWGTQKGEGT